MYFSDLKSTRSLILIIDPGARNVTVIFKIFIILSTKKDRLSDPLFIEYSVYMLFYTVIISSFDIVGRQPQPCKHSVDHAGVRFVLRNYTVTYIYHITADLYPLL